MTSVATDSDTTDKTGTTPAPPAIPEKQSFWTTLPGVLAALAGVAVAAAGLLKVLGEFGLVGQKPPPVQVPEKSPQPSPFPTPSPSPSPPITPPTASALKAELFALISSQQARYVRVSFGENASQNFTAKDLVNFHESRVLAAVETDLKGDARFQALSRFIRALPQSERETILLQAARLFKPT